MPIELETDAVFSAELISTLAINGDACEVIAGTKKQQVSEYDGAVTGTWKLLVKTADFPSLYFGEKLDIDEVEWEITDLDDTGVGAVAVDLVRYLS